MHSGIVMERELVIKSRTDELYKIWALVRMFCGKLSNPALGDRWIWLLVLAANEAAANIIVHEYNRDSTKEIRIVIREFENEVSVELHYEGAPFIAPPPELPALEEYPERGFGRFIISQCVDDVTYFRKHDAGMGIRLVKKRG